MSIHWKIDVLPTLKENGYSSYRLRKDKIFGERVIQQLRNGEPVSWEVLSRLCDLLACDIGDLLTASGAADQVQGGSGLASGQAAPSGNPGAAPGRGESPEYPQKKKGHRESRGIKTSA